ncbi:DUF4433 domain-containing protein [bacterium]|nr:DUF4433 domain-containing protein [bacterium]
MKHPREKYIFHITHIRNLPGIIRTGGLYCDNERLSRGINNLSIAHQEIKDRRARRQVSVAAHGTVADYVPFYFAPRSPMLCAIHHGNVVGYQDGQEKVVYLITNITEACNCGQAWCFTDGHAEMLPSEFYDDLNQLSQINWNVMRSKYWNDTPDAPDRKRQRQAEFLVHKCYPWSKVLAIAVMNNMATTEVEKHISMADFKPRIVVKSGWYF